MAELDQALAFHRAGKLGEAARIYQSILEQDPSDLEACYHLSILFWGQGVLDRALELARQAALLDERSARGQAHLGGILLALDRPAEALQHLGSALALQPDRADALNNMGVALRATDRLEESLPYFVRALELAPNYTDARFNLAGALAKCERFEESVPHYKLLLQDHPASAQFHYALGQALWKSDHYEAAFQEFDRTIGLEPGFAPAHAAKANALTESGRFEEAVPALREAIRLAPERAEYYRFLADVAPSAISLEHVAALESLARGEDRLSDDERIEVHFALAKIYAAAGERDRSLEQLLLANAHKRRFVRYDESETLEAFERIAATFDGRFLNSREGCSSPSTLPVFIFGMPRSGTTLIEQILASHPHVYGAGELSFFADIAEKVLSSDGPISPAEMQNVSCERLRNIGERYAAELVQLAPPGTVRVTDKMPANFTHVGLIRMVLPNARLIHATRDPVDTCMSCFSHYFAGGQPWAYDLGELGRYYRGYARLMDHWRTVLGEAMLEVRYEDVVDDFETQARRIIAHCGLEWDDACLQFHKTERKVKTASATQVRQPIYRTSVRGWRNSERSLGQLINALGLSHEGS
jgi:tetratricopeptide (TPR) repeat protein